MITLTATITLALSLIGIGLIIYSKIPRLLELSEIAASPFSFRKFFLSTKDSVPTGGFSSNLFLQKVLSRVRILTLKTDSKTSNLLQTLREKSQKNKFRDENYWKEIKKKIR